MYHKAVDVNTVTTELDIALGEEGHDTKEEEDEEGEEQRLRCIAS